MNVIFAIGAILYCIFGLFVSGLMLMVIHERLTNE